MTTDGDSILDALWKRQITTCSFKNELISSRVLRKVILLPKSKFSPVWSKESQKHICIGLDRRIYFDNHHSCYFNDGFGGCPDLRYQLNSSLFRSDLHHKILGVLLYHCHMLKQPAYPEEEVVCLLVLTADGFLKVLNADSGAILRSIFLSTVVKYRYLLWASYLKTVQVKSIHPPKLPRSSRVGVANSRLMTIAVFHIHPLELFTCFHVDKKIFGEDIVDAFVNEDLLVISHRGGTINMYSLSWIVKHFTMLSAPLGKFLELPSRGRSQDTIIRAGGVGNPGFGIPCTVEITERPPLVFTARTTKDAGISFGGHPTIYLCNDPLMQDHFLLTSLHKRELITVLKTEKLAFHSDVAEFHFDDHRRVLHISGCSLSCHRLLYDEKKEKHQLHTEYKIDFRDLLRNRLNSHPVRTSSGRVVKQRFASTELNDLYTSAVQDVDYENEMDLLYAVVTLPDKTSEANMQCNLYFINERDGSILKTVPLPTWEPDGKNSIYYELDCILHLVQSDTSSISTLHYYRLGC